MRLSSSQSAMFVDWRFTSGSFSDIAKKFEELDKNLQTKHFASAISLALKKDARGVTELRRIVRKSFGKRKKFVLKAKDAKRNAKSGRFTKNNRTAKVGDEFIKAIRIVRRKPRYYKSVRMHKPLMVRLGWDYGIESKKAIWLDEGTKHGIAPRRYIEQASKTIMPKAMFALPWRLKEALEAGVREQRSKRYGQAMRRIAKRAGAA